MKKIAAYMLIPFFAMQTGFLIAQASERPTPWFTLSVEEAHLSPQARYSVNDHELLVNYTNVSDAVQKDNCANIPWIYKEVVLLDGVPGEKRKMKKENSDGNSESGQIKIRVFRTEADTCGGATGGINPGQSIIVPLWISSY